MQKKIPFRTHLEDERKENNFMNLTSPGLELPTVIITINGFNCVNQTAKKCNCVNFPYYQNRVTFGD